MNSKEFREARKRLGMTQAQLGALLGVPQQRIYEIERRNLGPTAWQAGTIRLLEKWSTGVMFSVVVEMVENKARKNDNG